MIYLVHEWCEHEHSSYFIDVDKLDLTNTYELAYRDILEIAFNEEDKSFFAPEEPALMAAIAPHFGSLEASNMSSRTHVKLPCRVDREVSLYFS